jgi:hypothetical protein
MAVAQNAEETSAWMERIKVILAGEKTGNHLLYRLDTLKSEFIPSRSRVVDYFNRDLDFGYRHRRLNVELNMSMYQVDLLCFHDTIYLSSVITDPEFYWEPDLSSRQFDSAHVMPYLSRRNRFYRSKKDVSQLFSEISLDEEYAFYCGYADSKTEKGRYIDSLVDAEDVSTLTDMLKSINCETQSYGIAGLERLEAQNVDLAPEITYLIRYVKRRNSELTTCSGCLRGLVTRIYSRK